MPESYIWWHIYLFKDGFKHLMSKSNIEFEGQTFNSVVKRIMPNQTFNTSVKHVMFESNSWCQGQTFNTRVKHLILNSYF
jgi:hypothetical protein